MKSILFRADSSIDIGSGHIMRCLTLADELKKKGWETSFISRNIPGNNFEEINSRGHILKILHQPKDYVNKNIKKHYDKFMGVTEEYDAEEMKNVLGNEKFDWIVVDHYNFGQKWESQMRNISEKIFVIDDLVDKKHDCNLLLNHTNLPGIRKKYNNLISNDTKLLLGPKYLLLNPKFLDYKNRINSKSGSIKRIFIFYGGTDPTNETGKALESFIILDKREIIIDVVIGRNNLNREKIKLLVSKIENAYLHIQVSNIAEIMVKADLALGAGGYTIWEQFYLGVPSLITGIAENQVKPSILLDKMGCLIWLGLAKNVSIERITNKLHGLFAQPKLLIKQSKIKMTIVDGFGTRRVIEKLACA